MLGQRPALQHAVPDPLPLWACRTRHRRLKLKRTWRTIRATATCRGGTAGLPQNRRVRGFSCERGARNRKRCCPSACFVANCEHRVWQMRRCSLAISPACPQVPLAECSGLHVQMQWLQQTLKNSRSASERCIVACHHPIGRGAGRASHQAWGAADIVNTLKASGNVIAVFSGHVRSEIQRHFNCGTCLHRWGCCSRPHEGACVYLGSEEKAPHARQLGWRCVVWHTNGLEWCVASVTKLCTNTYARPTYWHACAGPCWRLRGGRGHPLRCENRKSKINLRAVSPLPARWRCNSWRSAMHRMHRPLLALCAQSSSRLFWKPRKTRTPLLL